MENLNERLTEVLGLGWEAEAVQRFDNPGYTIYITGKINLGLIDFRLKTVLPKIFEEIEVLLNNFEPHKYKIKSYEDNITTLNNTLLEKDKEIEKLKQYETYFLLEKEMRSKE